MELKTGYKQTEVGVIPEEWDVARVGETATKIGSGITPTGGERIYKKEGRPFLRSQNVGWGALLLDDLAFIDETIHSTFPDTEIKVGDVFLNITGASIGRSSVADSRVEGGNVNQDVCIVRVDQRRLVPHFLNLFLLSSAGQRQIDSFQAGGNRQGLNFAQVRSI
jgi:type I restriction enzyme S subunit